MNTIGISCTNFTKSSFGEIHELVSGKFSHWEIFSELNHYLPEVCENNYELVRGSPLSFTLHTGIGDINVASTNELIREASVANIISEMKAANKLGIDTATIHPGIVNMAVKGTREKSITQACKSMREIEAAASEYGITACIENMPNFPMMLGIEAEELGMIVEGTDLSICFDIGHANTFDQIENMVELFGDRIRNIHIHDNLGKSDDHMTIGDGSIDFKKVMSLLHSYKHRYIIESKTLDSAVTSQERLRELLGAQ